MVAGIIAGKSLTYMPIAFAAEADMSAGADTNRPTQ